MTDLTRVVLENLRTDVSDFLHKHQIRMRPEIHNDLVNLIQAWMEPESPCDHDPSEWVARVEAGELKSSKGYMSVWSCGPCLVRTQGYVQYLLGMPVRTALVAD